MKLILDIEANGFQDTATRIHVVCVRDVDTDEVWSFRCASEFIRWFESHQHRLDPIELIGHNLLCFDLPLLERIWGVPFRIAKDSDEVLGVKCKVVDTWHISMFCNPDRPGGHSLDNLAKLAGSHKQDYKGGFEEYSPEMEAYSHQDTKATAAVYKYLMKEIGEKYG